MAIGEGGRAYFIVNTWENKWEFSTAAFEETESKAYQCRENLESDNIANQDHFINSDQWGGIEFLDKGVENDLLIYGEGNQETLLQIGKSKHVALFGTPTFEWTYSYSTNPSPDLGLSTPHQHFKGFFNNQNFKENRYNVGNIQILGFEYEAIYLSQFLKATGQILIEVLMRIPLTLPYAIQFQMLMEMVLILLDLKNMELVTLILMTLT